MNQENKEQTNEFGYGKRINLPYYFSGNRAEEEGKGG
jgi:hypothetical protein